MPKKKLTAAFVDKVKVDVQIDYYDKHTKGLGLRVSPGGAKTFFYRYRFAAKNRRYSIDRYSDSFTLSDARAKADELRSYVKRGGDPSGEERRARQREVIELTTFKELAKEFQSIHVSTLRKKTQDEHNRIINNELIPVLGKHNALDITKSQVISLLDKKAIKDDKKTMANRIRARLHSIFEFGIQRGKLTKNPVTGIKPYSTGETKRDRFYSEKEINILWKAFSDIDEPAGSIMKMLLLTGQRKTETMRMKWENIEGDVWTIPATLAKGKRTHHVPLSHLAIEVLNKMKRLKSDKEYVFSSPVNPAEAIQDIKRQVNHVRKYSDDSDITVKDFRLHDLRRTAATYMAELNVDRTVLGKILNHKGVAGDGLVTAIYDRHDYMKEKKSALQKWAFRLEHITSVDEETTIHKLRA